MHRSNSDAKTRTVGGTALSKYRRGPSRRHKTMAVMAGGRKRINVRLELGWLRKWRLSVAMLIPVLVIAIIDKTIRYNSNYTEG